MYGLYLPALQERQELWPVLYWYLPAPQDLQDEEVCEPLFWYWPLLQLEQLPPLYRWP